MEDERIFEPVITSGSPQEIGAAFGRVNASSVQTHLREFMELCAREKLDDMQVVEKSHPGLQIVRTVAPWWEIEMDAIADAAGVAPDLYRAFCIGKYRRLFFGSAECTSYAATGSYIPFSGTSFHKSRDNVSRLQCAFVRRIEDSTQQIYAWCGTSDTSDPTTMMFVNEQGLAGAADTGGRTDDFRGEGLMNTFGLRYVAETCRDCHEAADTLREWSDLGYYAGGNSKTNWMFSDTAGTILRAVQGNHSIEAKFTTEGIVTNCERRLLEPTLLRQSGYLDAVALSEASRIKSVSMPSTISSMSADCVANDPQHLTCAWFGLGRPTRAPYLPLFVASRTVPRAMLDGSLYRRSFPSRATTADLRKLERTWKTWVDDCLQQAHTLISAGHSNDIADLTEQVTDACVRDAFVNMMGEV
jgi:hypothetical protein